MRTSAVKFAAKKGGKKGSAVAAAVAAATPSPSTAAAAPPAVDPRALIITSSYRQCLKELSRALALHQGNTTHIVKAVFGSLMDMETLRRAALMGTAATAASTDAASIAAAGKKKNGNNKNKTTTTANAADTADGLAVVTAPPLAQPPHVFDPSLRPSNVKVVLPGALRMFLEDQNVNISAATDASDNNADAASAAHKNNKAFLHHPDGAALAAILRLFFQSATSDTNLLYGSLAAPPSTAAGAKKSSNNNSKKNGGDSDGDDGDADAHDALVQSLLSDPLRQVEALTKSFELIKRLREATAGYPRPIVATTVVTTPSDTTSNSNTTKKGQKKATAKGSKKDKTAADAETTAATTTTALSSVVEIAPSIEESNAFINQCIQIVNQFIPAGQSASAALLGKNAGADGRSDDPSANVRSLFSRVGFPHTGNGDISSLRHLYVPNDPFHVNSLADDLTVSFAPELAVIEALAAMVNATRNEVCLLSDTDANSAAVDNNANSATATSADAADVLYTIPSAHSAIVTQDAQTGVIRWQPPQGTVNPNNSNSSKKKEDSSPSSSSSSDDASDVTASVGQYSVTTAYARSTPGVLLHVIPSADQKESLDKLVTVKSLLAPTVEDKVSSGKVSRKNKDGADAADKNSKKHKKGEASTPVTADDILEPRGSLAALNSEFGGVRSPFFDAQTPTASSAASSSDFISLPRPIETAHGASLFTFKEINLLRPDLPWYQCASPRLYKRKNKGGVNATATAASNNNSKKGPSSSAQKSSAVVVVPASKSVLPKAILKLRSAASAHIAASFSADGGGGDLLASSTNAAAMAEARKITTVMGLPAAAADNAVAKINNDEAVKKAMTGIVAQIPKTTTTVTNGIISITVTTTYAGVNTSNISAAAGGSAAAQSDLNPHGEPRHIFQYRVTIRNISGGHDDTTADKKDAAAAASSSAASASAVLNRSNTDHCNKDATGVKVTIVSRHWAFVDAITKSVKEVVGPGLVGNSPRLLPGESFTYESGTTMATAEGGYMRGTVQCVALSNDEESALIESLEAKRVLADHYEREKAKREKENGGRIIGKTSATVASSKTSGLPLPLPFTAEDIDREVDTLLSNASRATQACFDASICATALRK